MKPCLYTNLRYHGLKTHCSLTQRSKSVRIAVIQQISYKHMNGTAHLYSVWLFKAISRYASTNLHQTWSSRDTLSQTQCLNRLHNCTGYYCFLLRSQRLHQLRFPKRTTLGDNLQCYTRSHDFSHEYWRVSGVNVAILPWNIARNKRANARNHYENTRFSAGSCETFHPGGFFVLPEEGWNAYTWQALGNMISHIILIVHLSSWIVTIQERDTEGKSESEAQKVVEVDGVLLRWLESVKALCKQRTWSVVEAYREIALWVQEQFHSCVCN